jgi:Holliday junction resolvase RusA-like endonuclease
MIKIGIKPLSVNQAWKGKRYKTEQYKKYEFALLLLLPEKLTIPVGPLKLYYEFGFSSAASDNDNPVKPLQDIISKKYKFNDNRIFETLIRKTKVKKGAEYLTFEISPFGK